MTKLTKRLQTILDELSPCETFADVGCDHGYIAESMLKSGKCNFAYVTDISEKCLNKAVELLSKNYEGKFKQIVTDGLKNVPKVDQVLIAGMGGENICEILDSADFLPERMVLQPMKNSDKVRLKALTSGYKLIKDYTFKDEKYYDIIVCEKGKDFYTPDELKYGRGNICEKRKEFIEQITDKLHVLQNSLQFMSEAEKITVLAEIDHYVGLINFLKQ